MWCQLIRASHLEVDPHARPLRTLDDGQQPLSYAELLEAVRRQAKLLHEAGLGAGDKVGIRIPSGTRELYVSILATLYIGAAYVPVDADDPDERARLVFSEAKVAGILKADGEIVTSPERPAPSISSSPSAARRSAGRSSGPSPRAVATARARARRST